MPDMKIKFKLPFLGIKDKDFLAMPFGRRLEYARKIVSWKASAKLVWLSHKNRSTKAAIDEFISLYKPTEYYIEYHPKTGQYWDDSFAVFYTAPVTESVS